MPAPLPADDHRVQVRAPLRQLLICAVLLSAFISVGISACLQTKGQRRAVLRRRASEILPPGARVRAFGYGDCVELAPGPSCARVVFELPQHDSGRRARDVRKAARSHGWTITRSGDAAGGWNIFLKRDGYTAFVVLWRSEAYPQVDCRPSKARDDVCFNTLNLTRG